MELALVKIYKKELQKKIAELLKDFENKTELEVSDIDFVRQSEYDAIGNENDYSYAVEAKVVV